MFKVFGHFLKYLFVREKGREGETEEEKHQSVASHMLPIRDLDYNPSMCPDWDLIQQPFGLWYNTQPIEPHQSGYFLKIFAALISFSPV